MTNYDPLRLAIVGTGNIAGAYARSLATHPEKARLIGAFDVVSEAAAAFVGEHGGVHYPSFDALLADDAVELVVNLTSHHAHAQVSSAVLSAGKHVHSEKPLAATLADGRMLLDLAAAKGVRLSCSPFTFLGEGQQTALKALRDGVIGPVRAAYSEMNWDRIERWHPNPAGFFAKGAGPLLDVGVYALTVLTTLLGPVKRVRGIAYDVLPQRVVGRGPRQGETFIIGTPDLVVGGLEFASGAVARLTASFFVGRGSKQGPRTELHSKTGSLILNHNHNFEGPVEHYDGATSEWRTLPFVREPYIGVEWGRAIFDLADSLRLGTPQRVTGTQAYHVLEICLGILQAADEGGTVEINSTFAPPPPMPWAE